MHAFDRRTDRQIGQQELASNIVRCTLKWFPKIKIFRCTAYFYHVRNVKSKCIRKDKERDATRCVRLVECSNNDGHENVRVSPCIGLQYHTMTRVHQASMLPTGTDRGATDRQPTHAFNPCERTVASLYTSRHPMCKIPYG